MASEVSVINRALGHVGSEPIVTRTQDVKRARAADGIYDSVRDFVFRDHPWNALTARARLAANATAPPFDWDLAFDLPALCVRVLAVNDEQWTARVGFEVSGRQILTDWVGPLDVKYVESRTDPNIWDAQLLAAVALRLASELAMPLAQDKGLADLLAAAYERTKIDARIVDGLEEDVPERDEESDLLGARFR